MKLSPTGPPIAPLPSAVKVYSQDSDAPSSVREEPSVVAEPARPRPSTVTVIHTGTKWRQVPREVSWETTELWDGKWPSQASSFNVFAQFAHPATSHLFLPTTGGIWGALAQLHLAQHGGSACFHCRTKTGETHLKLSLWRPRSAWICLADKWAAGLRSATLKETVIWSCFLDSGCSFVDETLCFMPCINYPAWKCRVESCYASEI